MGVKTITLPHSITPACMWFEVVLSPAERWLKFVDKNDVNQSIVYRLRRDLETVRARQ